MPKKKKKKAKVDKFVEHDCVVLLEDIKDDDGNTIERGCSGTIVHIHDDRNFSVEFAGCIVTDVKLKQVVVMRSPRQLPETVTAEELLFAERDRLKVMAKASKGKAKEFITGLAHMYNISATFLGSLNAPERIQRYQKVAVTDGP